MSHEHDSHAGQPATEGTEQEGIGGVPEEDGLEGVSDGDVVTEGSEDSFPASDPPAWMSTPSK